MAELPDFKYEIVDRIDSLAYERGTNRSNLINQILAEYVSYTTPEMRMHAIFEEMEKLKAEVRQNEHE